MHRSARRTAALLALLLVVPACAASATPAPDLAGQRVEVLATWSGVEQERFARVLDRFAERTGAVVSYTSARHRLPDELAERLAAGRPPDVAFLPQPGLLRELAAAGHLVPADAETGALVRRHFSPVFVQLGSVDDQLYGVWFKAANKSLVWYDVALFERLGEVPPHDLDGLLELARRTTAAGTPAFALAALDSWTLTDWFENVYARVAGLQAYDDLAAHRIPWTDPSVARTLQLLSELWSPDAVAGGTDGALRTGFEESVRLAFGRTPTAAMVVEGDFVAGAVSAATRARLQVDVDVFPFPAGADGVGVVVGGGDVAVQLRSSVAAAALLGYLATPEAAEVWAAAGGFLSPNVDLDLAVYPDDVTRNVARRLLEAGEDFRFDLSDLQPAAFGSDPDAGMRGELRDFLVHRDVALATERLEQAARAAHGATP
jgi:alpha-glucoside transport system substrate-binding protein